MLLTINGEISTPEVRIILSKGGERFVLTTEKNYEGTEEPLGLPNITVDGTESEELPSAVEEYAVTLDLSFAVGEGYTVEGVWILPFGKINLDI
jgi:hypothetical protein